MLGAVLRAEHQLGEDRVDVLLDARRRDVERVRDRRIGLALGHLAQHLHLTGGERLEQGPRGLLPTPQQALDDLRIDDRSPRSDFAQGSQELVQFAHPILEKVGEPGRAVAEQFERVQGVHILGEDDDAHVRMPGADLVGGLDPLHLMGRRHADVGDDRIRVKSLHCVQQQLCALDGGDAPPPRRSTRAGAVFPPGPGSDPRR